MQFSYYLYRKHFDVPLVTNHGIWTTRNSIIVSLKDDYGRIGKGEIAPLPWFGSETFEEALNFCKQYQFAITPEEISNIPAELPCCRFAFESAIFHLTNSLLDEKLFNFKYSCLLSAGEKALEQITPDSETFKWKIGVLSSKLEQNIFLHLVEALPVNSNLRLDANGGLTLEEAKSWLALADKYSNLIEYIEQPLSPKNLDLMFILNRDYATSIALDESVSNYKEMESCLIDEWQGIYIIKPAIFGSIFGLRQICQKHSVDMVFSSVFETEIGRSMSLYLAQELANPTRALGYPPKNF
jgi:O-succinylbenzoate synthase